jgi:SynChlorMet cassette protein ScmD
MDTRDRPIANPEVVLREEFDDWAVLFDPDSGEAFGLNPVGVFIWKRLDGKRTPAEIIGELRQQCDNVPDEGFTGVTPTDTCTTGANTGGDHCSTGSQDRKLSNDCHNGSGGATSCIAGPNTGCLTGGTAAQ